MNVNKLNRFFLPLLFIAACACNNNDQQHTTDTPKDSAAVASGGSGGSTADAGKQTDTSTIASAKKTISDAKDSVVSKVGKAVAKADEKAKTAIKDVATETKKAAHKVDSAIAAKKDELTSAKKDESTATKKETASSTDDEGLLPPSAADNSKSTSPKFGIIPRDANENNINSFKSAFPDKKTLIRVNFDADPDAEMTATKTQIIKALKKSGYSNISQKSSISHPGRMPKDIHFELQHDGSVIIWLQPNA